MERIAYSGNFVRLCCLVIRAGKLVVTLPFSALLAVPLLCSPAKRPGSLSFSLALTGSGNPWVRASQNCLMLLLKFMKLSLAFFA